MQLLITGVTGLVGQHLLFEALQQSLRSKFSSRIVVLIRGQQGESAQQRLRALLAGPLPDFLKPYSTQQLLRAVSCIESDISDPALASKWRGMIDPKQQLCIVHAAGSVNLFSSPEAEIEIKRTNYHGTFRLLQSFAGCPLKFCFVSTAFSAGIREGLIENNLLDSSRVYFRNPYERIKAKTENELSIYCSRNNVRLQILRPSVVCGRLLEPELFYTSKFDVLYGWAKYFWVSGNKHKDHHMRIFMRPDSNLNIVPVDYVAKKILAAVAEDAGEINLVHSKSIPISFVLSTILQTVGFPNFEFVSAMPENLNRLEKHYYQLVHSAFGPYMTSPATEFDASAVASVGQNIPEPDVKNNFKELIAFAVKNQFTSQYERHAAKPLLARHPALAGSQDRRRILDFNSEN